jgi:acetyl-CoA synthetase
MNSEAHELNPLRNREAYKKAYEESLRDRDGFWLRCAKIVDWYASPSIGDRSSFSGKPEVRWFEDGVLNACYNCVDRHAERTPNKTAIIFEPDCGEPKYITYGELYEKVCLFGDVLLRNGGKREEIITVYLPMIPEAIYAALACARLGIPHSVVFSGFSSTALACRLAQAKSRIVITTRTSSRGGRVVSLGENACKAVEENQKKGINAVEKVLFVEDFEWARAEAKSDEPAGSRGLSTYVPHVKCVPVKATDPLFILYTSGSTGTPKGLVHSTGGYLVYTAITQKLIFDMSGSDQSYNQSCENYCGSDSTNQQTFCDPTHTQSQKELMAGEATHRRGAVLDVLLKPSIDSTNQQTFCDCVVYFCTADIGWITGHSYGIYGPLANGATIVLFQGIPTHPNASRYWHIISKHKVSIFYTSPTALRSLRRLGDSFITEADGVDLSSLRVLGSVGEPIDPATWQWFFEKIGGGRCPIMDTWWQTESGGALICPLLEQPQKPGCAAKPFLGICACLEKTSGTGGTSGKISNTEKTQEDIRPTAAEETGCLCIEKAWPGQAIGVYNDLSYFENYFRDGKFVSGDEARVDEDGDFWLLGRLDDVLNVSGHRFNSAELEYAAVSHQAIAEVCVVGFPHNIKGQGICIFAVLKGGGEARSSTEELCGSEPQKKLATAVSDELGAIRDEVVRKIRAEIGPIASPDLVFFVRDLPKTRSGKIVRRILRKIVEALTKIVFAKSEETKESTSGKSGAEDNQNIGEIAIDVGDTSMLTNPSVIEEIKCTVCTELKM